MSKKTVAGLGKLPAEKKKVVVMGIPEIGEPIKLADVMISRRPTSTLKPVGDKVIETMKALVKGEALPVKNLSPSQRSQMVKYLKDKGMVFSFGYNVEHHTLYIWTE